MWQATVLGNLHTHDLPSFCPQSERVGVFGVVTIRRVSHIGVCLRVGGANTTYQPVGLPRDCADSTLILESSSLQEPKPHQTA